MNFFDSTIIDFTNQFAQRSSDVDALIYFLSGNHLVKGGFLLIIFWWGWFRVNKYQPHVQLHLITTLFSSITAIIVARSLAKSLPFRLRPIHDESIGFTLPYSMEPTILDGWSSLPSDHAVLFYALSAGMFYISKRVGIFALIYTTLFIGLPRIYLGLHYPTDILVGAFIGITITAVCNSNYFIVNKAQSVLGWSHSKPEFFYPTFFIITYQIADMFNSSRSLISFLIQNIQTILL